ncbi:MAG: hypothetical protein KDK26_04450 [Roseivivax sp.]|nr:hypothetical protein [Roseivivax sp.]
MAYENHERYDAYLYPIRKDPASHLRQAHLTKLIWAGAAALIFVLMLTIVSSFSHRPSNVYTAPVGGLPTVQADPVSVSPQASK